MVDSDQIFRIDGKNVFLEVKNGMFDKEKVLMNFIEYDVNKPKGNRKTKEISIFVDIAKFLLLTQDILSGRINAIAKKVREEQQRGGYKYCKEVWHDMGGTSAEKLKEQNKVRADGKSHSRQIKITPGDKFAWIISAESGEGEMTETGLIVPRYIKPEAIIRIPMTNEDLKSLVLIVKAHIEGYITSKYLHSYFQPEK